MRLLSPPGIHPLGKKQQPSPLQRGLFRLFLTAIASYTEPTLGNYRTMGSGNSRPEYNGYILSARVQYYQRQWCRLIVRSSQLEVNVRDNEKIVDLDEIKIRKLMKFFAMYPGLHRYIGSIIVQYTNDNSLSYNKSLPPDLVEFHSLMERHKDRLWMKVLEYGSTPYVPTKASFGKLTDATVKRPSQSRLRDK